MVVSLVAGAGGVVVGDSVVPGVVSLPREVTAVVSAEPVGSVRTARLSFGEFVTPAHAPRATVTTTINEVKRFI
jgi:hypothetical protein